MTIRERRRTRSWRGEAIAGERSASEVESEAPDSMYQLMVMCSKGDVGVVGGTWEREVAVGSQGDERSCRASKGEWARRLSPRAGVESPPPQLRRIDNAPFTSSTVLKI